MCVWCVLTGLRSTHVHSRTSHSIQPLTGRSYLVLPSCRIANSALPAAICTKHPHCATSTTPSRLSHVPFISANELVSVHRIAPNRSPSCVSSDCTLYAAHTMATLTGPVASPTHNPCSWIGRGTIGATLSGKLQPKDQCKSLPCG